MTTKQSRKAAIQAFKERVPPRGAFAVRCGASGRVWVGASPNLTAAKNGLWMALRIGAYMDRALQAEWNAAGEASFSFDILETLEPDVSAVLVPVLLKEKKRNWAAQLGAAVLL